MSKQELKKLLSQGRVQKVIDTLLELKNGDSFHNEVVKLSARWEGLETDKINRTKSDDALSISSNQIHEALLHLIDKSDRAPTKRPEGNSHVMDEKDKRERKKSIAWWRYIVGFGVLIGIAAGIISSLKHLGYIGSDSGADSRSITVLAHGPKGKDDILLPSRGLVYLIYGDAKISEEINREGEATFKQISETFFQDGASVELLFDDPLGEPYRARYPDSSYQLEAGQYISLEVVLEGMDQLEGTVKDFVSGLPVDSALVRIRGNSYYTNEFGEFTIDVPQERQEQFIDLSISKPGYELKELTKVPTTTNQPQKISLKPIK